MPGHPANGKAILKNSGFSALYECDEGFEVSGNFERACTEEDIWSGHDPSCSKSEKQKEY